MNEDTCTELNEIDLSCDFPNDQDVKCSNDFMVSDDEQFLMSLGLSSQNESKNISSNSYINKNFDEERIDLDELSSDEAEIHQNSSNSKFKQQSVVDSDIWNDNFDDCSISNTKQMANFALDYYQNNRDLQINNFDIVKRSKRKIKSSRITRKKRKKNLNAETVDDEKMLGIANEAIIKGDHDKAKELLLELIRSKYFSKTPILSAYYKSLSYLYESMNDKKSALLCEVRSTKNSVSTQVDQLDFAKRAEECDAQEIAEYCYHRLQIIKPKNLEILIKRARILIKIKQYSRAVYCINVILSISPSHLQSILNVTNLLFFKLCKSNKAIDILENYIENCRKKFLNCDHILHKIETKNLIQCDNQVLLKLCLFYEYQHKYDKVLELIQEVQMRSLNKKLTIDFEIVKCINLLYLGRDVDVDKILTPSIINSNKLKFSDYFFRLGSAYFSSKKYENARKYFLLLQTLEKYHSLPTYLMLFGRCELYLLNYNNATKYFNKVIELTQDNPNSMFLMEARLLLADTYSNTGRTNLALDVLEKKTDNNSKNGTFSHSFHESNSSKDLMCSKEKEIDLGKTLNINISKIEKNENITNDSSELPYPELIHGAKANLIGRPRKHALKKSSNFIEKFQMRQFKIDTSISNQNKNQLNYKKLRYELISKKALPLLKQGNFFDCMELINAPINDLLSNERMFRTFQTNEEIIRIFLIAIKILTSKEYNSSNSQRIISPNLKSNSDKNIEFVAKIHDFIFKIFGTLFVKNNISFNSHFTEEKLKIIAEILFISMKFLSEVKKEFNKTQKSFIEIARLILYFNPDSFEYANFMHHLLIKYDYESNISRIIKRLNTKKDSIPIMLLNAEIFVRRRSYIFAANIYFKLILRYPNYPHFWLMFASLSLVQIKRRTSLNRHYYILHSFAILFHYARLRHQDAQSCYNLARAYHQIGLDYLAIEFYKRVLYKNILSQKFQCKDSLENPGFTIEGFSNSNSLDELRHIAAKYLSKIYLKSGLVTMANELIDDYCIKK